MYFRIALNSVKKSLRDYTVYFLTLTFAVCIFYSFNSIGDQKTVLAMSKSSLDYLEKMSQIISIISVFVSFVLGGLIIYANNFLIKKRKKELGIYMTLGMSRGKISTILVVEIFIIGCFSLCVGLLLGIGVSQLSSELIARLFRVDMNNYKLIVSYSGLDKTCLYFGIIFALVGFFNHVVVSKYKLIDLLNASKKNEVLKAKNTVFSIVCFLLSVGILGLSYKLVIKAGFNPYDPEFLAAIVLGILGTLICFFSLSGFFVHILEKSKNLYFKNLNIFILRQINNKINTNFVSMTVVSLMLVVTIISLFVMLNYKTDLDRTTVGLAPFDASMSTSWMGKNAEIPNIKDELDRLNFKFKESEKHVFFDIYSMDAKYKDAAGEYLNPNSKTDARLMNNKFSVIKISDYNKIRELKEQAPVKLKDNELLVVSNYGNTSDSFKSFMKNEESIKLNGSVFYIKNKEIIAENVLNNPYQPLFLYLIVPDNFNTGLTLGSRALDVEFVGGDVKQSKERFSNLFYNHFKEFDDISGFDIELSTMVVYGASILVIFLGLYVGLVFLISSAVVLALQQLTEASDSLERYKILKKIGASEKMINKTIFMQTSIYFLVPFVLAIIHSIVGIKVMNDFFEVYNKSAINTSAVTLALIFVVVYGGYFYTTYYGYKSIIKNS